MVGIRAQLYQNGIGREYRMQGVFEEVFGSTGACLRVVREATSTASIGEDP